MVFYGSLVLVSCLSQGAILCDVIVLQLINLSIILLSLGFKELELLFKCLVARALHELNTPAGIVALLLKVLNDLLSHRELMLGLRGLRAVCQLQLGKVLA